MATSSDSCILDMKNPSSSRECRPKLVNMSMKTIPVPCAILLGGERKEKDHYGDSLALIGMFPAAPMAITTDISWQFLTEKTAITQPAFFPCDGCLIVGFLTSIWTVNRINMAKSGKYAKKITLARRQKRAAKRGTKRANNKNT
jgi:hypothetical protein